jgi:ABC-type branched-subunit amino acid transport system ATPase component
MEIKNLGCFSDQGVSVDLSDIVCLVGGNNTGKSTILRTYEAVVDGVSLRAEDINNKGKGHPATVVLWIHIPKGTPNIDEKWKEESDGMFLVRSKWEWPPEGGKAVRTTWDPTLKEYAEDGKASGLDEVFNSRLPKPFRIGSLENPADEHRKLLTIVLEPIASKLKSLIDDKGSALSLKALDMRAEAEKPVADFKETLAQVEKEVNKSYKRVFNASEIKFTVKLGDLAFDPSKSLMSASSVDVSEQHGQTRWDQQGTGSQRALFWSMLQVRSELNRKLDAEKLHLKGIKEKQKELEKVQKKIPALKTEPSKKKAAEEAKQLEEDIKKLKDGGNAAAGESTSILPGYMLLIDEPETALHPAAVRAAKEHLYTLAGEPGWQVMLSTHHPAFVDPLKDNTTIVRLHRPDAAEAPNLYRSNGIKFSDDEKELLRNLLTFDTTVAEMFFGSRVIIVEGDTEFASFSAVMDGEAEKFPISTRPLIIRARGKMTIPLLIRMLTHFKVDFSVLHDIDAPRTDSGAKSGAYTANETITAQVAAGRSLGIKITHRFSCPEFERKHGMTLSMKDKPYEAWKAVCKNAAVGSNVSNTLVALSTVEKEGQESEDGSLYEKALKEWVAKNAAKDPRFQF